MIAKTVHFFAVLSLGLVASCGTKTDPEAPVVATESEKETTNDTTPEPEFPTGIAPEEGQSAVSKSRDIANDLVGSIYDLVDYDTASLRLRRAGMNLDEVTIDTEAKWETQQTFNWFDDSHEGSATPKEFLQAALDPEQSNAPLYKMTQATSMMCIVGAMFGDDDLDADGMPKARALGTLTVDADAVSRIETECGDDFDEEVLSLIQVSVTDLTNDDYSKYIKMVIEGEETLTTHFYVGFSPTSISLLQWDESESETPTVNRTAYKYNPQTGEFAFEYFYRVFGSTFATKSYNHHRVAINEQSNEARVTAVMGSSDEENLTFIGLNGNFEESQAGASFYRIGPPDVSDQFVCVDVDDGSFVNTTGCTENADEDRLYEFNVDSVSFSSGNALEHDEWITDENVAPPAFDLDSILTEAVAN